MYLDIIVCEFILNKKRKETGKKRKEEIKRIKYKIKLLSSKNLQKC